MSESRLHPVELRGVPLSLARLSAEHHATLMRELALVDASDDVAAHRRLLAVVVRAPVEVLASATRQRARVEAAVAAGVPSLDLRYDVPADLADDIERLESLLDEVDRFCRDGELVTLVTPPELTTYRQWVFDQFVSQLREAAEPVAWQPGPADVVATTGDSPSSLATIAIDEDLDLEGSARACDEISQHLERGVTDLRIDLNNCEFVDSVGISLLLTTLARLRDAGGSIVLVNVSDAIQRTLRHAGIVDLLVRD